MGRTPAPTALKVVRGERPDRINQNEPRPTVSAKVPTCPAHLSASAKRVWRRLAPELHRAGVLTDWDREALGVWCEAVVIHRQAVEELQSAELVITGDNGNQVKNPLLQIVRDSAQTIRAFAGEFGLTPSSRGRISMPKGEELAAARQLLS